MKTFWNLSLKGIWPSNLNFINQNSKLITKKSSVPSILSLKTMAKGSVWLKVKYLLILSFLLFMMMTIIRKMMKIITILEKSLNNGWNSLNCFLILKKKMILKSLTTDLNRTKTLKCFLINSLFLKVIRVSVI